MMADPLSMDHNQLAVMNLSEGGREGERKGGRKS